MLLPAAAASAHDGAGTAARTGTAADAGLRSDETGSRELQLSWDQRVVVVRSTVPAVWGVRGVIRWWNTDRAQGQPRMVLRNNAQHADIVVRTMSKPHADYSGYAAICGCSGDTPRLITHADVYLNTPVVHRKEMLWNGSWKAFSHYITAHEIGHALGLHHYLNVERSVMSYTNPWWETGGRPIAFDHGMLANIY